MADLFLSDDELFQLKRAKSRERRRRWITRHPDREREQSKRYKQTPRAKELHRNRQLVYAAEHREQERLRAAAWRVQFPEKERQMRRSYYVRNTDVVKDRSRKHYRKNTQAYREYSAQYKAAKRAGGGRLKPGYRSRLFTLQNGICNGCRCDLSNVEVHVDHIVPIAKGGLHCEDNVQLLCAPCNRRKSAKDFDAFLKEMGYERPDST